MLTGKFSATLTKDNGGTATVSFAVDPDNFNGDEDDINNSIIATGEAIQPVLRYPAKSYSFTSIYKVDAA